MKIKLKKYESDNSIVIQDFPYFKYQNKTETICYGAGMKLVVFGSNGQTGIQVVLQALDRGYEVTAVARNPSTIGIQNPLLAVKKGDLFDLSSVELAVENQDVVISSVGSGGFRQSRRSTTVYSQGIGNIIEAMKRKEIKRLMVVTSGGVEDDPAEPFFYKRIIKPVIRETYKDMQRLETIIKKCDLDWTVIRPPLLLNKPRTGIYRTSLNLMPANGSAISRADLAEFILNQVGSDEFIHKFPTIAY